MTNHTSSLKAVPPDGREVRGHSAVPAGSLCAPIFSPRESTPLVRANSALAGFRWLASASFIALVGAAARGLRSINGLIFKGTKCGQRQPAACNSIYLGFGNDPYVPPSTAKGVSDYSFVVKNSFVRHALNLNERSNDEHDAERKFLPEKRKPGQGVALD